MLYWLSQYLPLHGIVPFLFLDNLLVESVQVITGEEMAHTMKSLHGIYLTLEILANVQNCISKSRRHVSESRKWGFTAFYLLSWYSHLKHPSPFHQFLKIHYPCLKIFWKILILLQRIYTSSAFSKLIHYYAERVKEFNYIYFLTCNS